MHKSHVDDITRHHITTLTRAYHIRCPYQSHHNPHTYTAHYHTRVTYRDVDVTHPIPSLASHTLASHHTSHHSTHSTHHTQNTRHTLASHHTHPPHATGRHRDGGDCAQSDWISHGTTHSLSRQTLLWSSVYVLTFSRDRANGSAHIKGRTCM